MPPEDFRRWAHEAADWMADYLAGVGHLPVLAQVEPGQVRAALPTLTLQQRSPATLARVEALWPQPCTPIGDGRLAGTVALTDRVRDGAALSDAQIKSLWSTRRTRHRRRTRIPSAFRPRPSR